MKNRCFKIKTKDLVEFLRSKKDNADWCCPKDSKRIEIKLEGNDYNNGNLTVLIELDES